MNVLQVRNDTYVLGQIRNLFKIIDIPGLAGVKYETLHSHWYDC